ncbi:MAG TPA: dTDP-4-dehydrorhamnose reductase [Solirubrobacteraceae bacterium]|nr:dTDP-4-dehydrorhamnose reductase [Solirubrobacteraceae bacterium]
MSVATSGGRNPLLLVVTGAQGMLGRRVVEAARAGGHEVAGLGRADCDLTSASSVRRAVGEHRPDAVINCAAWTDVDGAEEHEEEAQAVNATGAGVLAASACAVGARMVQVSTDYVFDGSKRTPWLEDDAVAPLGAYGRTKLEGERAVAAACADHAIARTAWLFGAGGRNFVDTMLSLGAQRDAVAVVSDQVGSPTWTGHLAPALVELAAGTATGIFHLAGGGSCSWHQLCVTTYRHAGLSTRVEETTSARFVRPAPRPAYSVLGTRRAESPRLADWREGLACHLAARAVCA